MDFPTNNSGASSSSFTPKHTYDVFLNFRGKDARCFTGHLYNVLDANAVYTFMDDEELPVGEDISQQLPKAIEESSISIVVFSENYASSTWCLDELVKILDCKKSKQLMVLPIFYNVDPGKVRRQRGKFKKAMAKHKDKFNYEKVQSWSEALTEAANLKGLSCLPNEQEHIFIRKIVEEVLNKLSGAPLHIVSDDVGIGEMINKNTSSTRTRSFFSNKFFSQFIYDEVIVDESKKEGTLKSSNRAFTHFEVFSITSGFINLIGEGGFGKVYRGTLNDTHLAVKTLSTSSKQGYEEFQAELHIQMMMVHHKNLLSLVGYCDEGDNKALIYEYMANGNLCQILSETSTKSLTWKERLQIALEVAQGLEHLHNGFREPIIHRDVNTSNILLNEKWEAKLADFGLSIVLPNEDASHGVSTIIEGTFGYIDPEYVVTSIVNKASDIYSFGVVLLELVTGRPAIIIEQYSSISITKWVTLEKKMDIGSIVDPRLQGTYNTASVKRFTDIAITCLQSPAAHRPKISDVCDDLKQSQKLQTDAERSQKKESGKTR